MKIQGKDYIVIAFSFLCLVVIGFYYNFTSDDAFISYRYGKNLANGLGLVYNGGEKVEGYTNFLWTIISSLSVKAGLNPLVISRILSSLSALFILFISLLMGKNIFNISYPFYYISLVLLSFNCGFIVWNFSGLETIFFTALVFAAVFFVLKFFTNNNSRYIYFSALFLLTASLTRPEGILFFVLIFLFLLYYLVKSEHSIYKAICILAVPAAIFIIFYGIYFVWRYNYYGYIFPNTFYVKTGGDLQQQLRGVYYLYKFIRENLAAGLLLLFPLYYLIRNFSDIRIRLIVFIISVYTLYIIYIGGDGLGIHRFFIPVLPLIYILLQNGIYFFLNKFSFSGIFKAVLITLIFFSTILVTFDKRNYPALGLDRNEYIVENLESTGKWLKMNAGKDETIAVEFAGIIPYYSELYTIDRLGLNEPYIAHKKYDNMGSGLAGHEKRDDEYVLLQRKPDYFMDELPASKPLHKNDMDFDSVKYKYENYLIGPGRIELRPGEVYSGDIYFNFYKRIK